MSVCLVRNCRLYRVRLRFRNDLCHRLTHVSIWCLMRRLVCRDWLAANTSSVRYRASCLYDASLAGLDARGASVAVGAIMTSAIGVETVLPNDRSAAKVPSSSWNQGLYCWVPGPIVLTCAWARETSVKGFGASCSVDLLSRMLLAHGWLWLLCLLTSGFACGLAYLQEFAS